MFKSRGEKIFHAFNYVFLTLVVLTTLLPFLNILATSFSDESSVLTGKVLFWPVNFNLSTYKAVFTAGTLLQSMQNTVYLTLVGTGVNMVMTILAAYPLSKKRLRGRSPILMFITFTMLFSAGMIPNFLLVKALGLYNTYWAVILPGAISTYNMIVMKTFFEAMPVSVEESASIDGCNDWQILFRIILPLSLPVLATIGLFYAVGNWNAYFNVMLYISDSAKKTLQVRLRDILNSAALDTITNSVRDVSDMNNVTQESVKSAAIVIATTPILLVYPFLQKYFVKGVMIGSIKG